MAASPEEPRNTASPSDTLLRVLRKGHSQYMMTSSSASTQTQPRKPKVRTFHGFPKLPAEIRLKIWFLALPGPRYMAITDYEQAIPDSCLAPALTHVNSESRMVFLAHYHRRIWKLPRPLRVTQSAQPQFYTKKSLSAKALARRFPDPYRIIWTKKGEKSYYANVTFVAVWMAKEKDFDFFEWSIPMPGTYFRDGFGRNT